MAISPARRVSYNDTSGAQAFRDLDASMRSLQAQVDRLNAEVAQLQKAAGAYRNPRGGVTVPQLAQQSVLFRWNGRDLSQFGAPIAVETLGSADLAVADAVTADSPSGKPALHIEAASLQGDGDAAVKIWPMGRLPAPRVRCRLQGTGDGFAASGDIAVGVCLYNGKSLSSELDAFGVGMSGAGKLVRLRHDSGATVVSAFSSGTGVDSGSDWLLEFEIQSSVNLGAGFENQAYGVGSAREFEDYELGATSLAVTPNGGEPLDSFGLYVVNNSTGTARTFDVYIEDLEVYRHPLDLERNY